ncbi:MAG: ATP-dependent helicase HrpB [Caulobacteraceae bacterium]|nr:ATP-dependent helicase HrpB [Caulobacteraceae bacterium]
MNPADLPIHQALPELRQALAERSEAVLVAPPGAGKTTVVPLALLDEAWAAGGKIIVLEPRRLAARAAAARMAATLGEGVGDTVGFRVRMQSRIGPRTRIEVVTEGVFTRMILGDPGLDGVSGVLFDEFHERSLDADLGLALARDAQQVLRPDLRLLVMSATLDGARISSLLGEAPIVQSEGRAFEVQTRYLGFDPAQRLEEQVARAVQTAITQESGGVLVFLPGAGEIRRVETLLRDRLAKLPADIHPLYGALERGEQDAAISPASPGRRKVVLATSIAETSLTLEGVRVVIDGGFSRVPRFDPSSGLTRLDTVRVSRASADQRRGRAGRTEPGVCYRLWDEAQTRALIPFSRPEIQETDLSRLAQDLARWGARDTDGLAFLDPPPKTAMAEARGLLQRLEALDGEGALTPHGQVLARIPLAPRLAHMVSLGGRRAGLIAALLTERGLGGSAVDLRDRLRSFERDRGERANEARRVAERWSRHAQDTDMPDAVLLAEAFPERIAKARGKAGEYQLVTGRGVYLEPTDPLAGEPWLAIGELGGGAARDRILLAAPLDPAELETAFAHQIDAEERLEPSPGGKLRLVRRRRLGKLTLGADQVLEADPVLIAKALLAEVRENGLACLALGEASEALRARVTFLRAQDPAWPDMSDPALAAEAEDWLAPLLTGKTALSQVRDHELAEALRNLIPWDRQRLLDSEAPTRFTAPTGNSFAIDYGAEGGPKVSVRVQELFGIAQHPVVAGAPLTFSLLSPGHKPIQTTQDLPGFWRGSWADVRKDMRGRYPRHVWPEDPANATPTARAKPRGT